MRLFIVAVVVAVLIVFLFTPDTPISGQELKLGDLTYDIKVLDAPVASGKLLEIFAALTGSRFGPSLRRFLLSNNHVHRIRELAAQVDLAPLYFPIRRLNTAERHVHEQAAAEGSLEMVLATGLGIDYSGSRWTSEDYARAYRSGKTTVTDVMKAAIAHVSKLETEGQRIFSSFLPDDILKQAAESDQRFAEGRPYSILDGVPIAFKDSIEAVGHTIYDGRNPKDPLSSHFCEVDDVIVARFRELGAIVFGMTVMTEGGVTPLGFNAHFQGPTSPFDKNRYSGGSSAGSGVAVATGLVPIAVGFDGGGSIRLPSTASGVHGLAVTFGRIPYARSTSTLTKSGPLAASAADVALGYAVMSPNLPGHMFNVRYDGDNLGPPPPHLSRFADSDDLSDVRIGVYRQWNNDADSAVVARCNAAIDYLVSRGATVVDIAIPHLQVLSLSHGLTISSEFASLFDLQFHTRRQTMELGTQVTVGLGATVTSQEFIGAAKLRAWASEYIEELFKRKKLTAIVTPTMPILPPVLEESAKPVGESNTALMVKMLKYVFLANFLGLPGYSVPVGFSEANNTSGEQIHLPIGLQLMGLHWSEAQLIRLARSVEKGFSSKLPQFAPLNPFTPSVH